MAFSLKTVVPWGRSFAEYAAMFALSPKDLKRQILACGDGRASFNAVLRRQGGSIVSTDPLYRFTAGQIRRRVEETWSEVLEQTERNREEFVWTAIPSVKELAGIQMEAMEEFLGDFPKGKKEGRYLAARLPERPPFLRGTLTGSCGPWMQKDFLWKFRRWATNSSGEETRC